MLTITIDCGTSFIKGAAFRDGVMQIVVNRPSPAVQEVESVFNVQWITLLTKTVRQMILELAGNEKEIILCISNEMHGFILAYADGRPYTDYISWQKEFGRIEINGKSAFQLLTEDEERREDIVNSGMPLRAGLPSSNLYYMSETGALLSDTELHFYTLGAYLLKALSGMEPAEHISNAAATGLYSLKSGQWNHRYIAAIGAERIIFPEVGQRSIVFSLDGVTVHALPAIGDQQSALLGAGLLEKEELSFNLGTGAQVSCLVETPTFGQGYQIRPYFYGKYLKTIPHIPSGRAINVYFRFVKSVLERYGLFIDDDAIWDGMLNAASKGVCDTGMECDMSFFENAVSQHTKGSIQQIGEYSLTLENLLCSVFQEMADNFIYAADKLAPDNLQIKRVIFSGGIARRIEMIRSRIIAHYPSSDVVVARNETLQGLLYYSQLSESMFHE